MALDSVRGIGKLWILNSELWIVGQVRRVGQVGLGENFEYEFWIGHKLQACTSGEKKDYLLW